jgi:aryl-alcohol dehydrogenase-like predicted oxidoreductase
LLTGKYKQGGDAPKGTRMAAIKRLADRFMTEDNWKKVDALQAFCDARGRTLLELAFSWLLSRPVLSSVIAGATKPEQIEANVKAAEWKLSANELADVDRIAEK